LLETLQSVHNLEELTHRPYTLKLVSEFIPDIEDERMAGKTVHGVTLYQRMARRWLERDAGKHHIRPQHKMRLAAHLAAHIWQSSDGLLPAGKIESWFHLWLENQPDLKLRYKDLHPDQLEEDLRTATFLTRRDSTRGSSFRFAHTSLLEFFLADYLFRALRDNTPEHWKLKRPSSETLDFLGQMLASTEEAEQNACLEVFKNLLTDYQAGTSELAFKYLIHAHEKKYPYQRPETIDLRGAELTGWNIGVDKGTRLDLTGTLLSGARLNKAVICNSDISGSDLSGVDAAKAEFQGVTASGCDWQGANLFSVLFRRCAIKGGNWQDTGLEKSWWS